MTEKQTAEIDAGLMQELRSLARKQNRPESELLEEIVRSYLVAASRESGNLDEFLERLKRRRQRDGVESLSEDEATRLATEELHVMRQQRQRSS